MTKTSLRNDINQQTKITYVRIDISMGRKYFQGTRTTTKKINEENKSKKKKRLLPLRNQWLTWYPDVVWDKVECANARCCYGNMYKFERRSSIDADERSRCSPRCPRSDRRDSLRERVIQGNSGTRSRTPMIEVRLPSAWHRDNPDMIDSQHPFWTRTWTAPSDERHIERALQDDEKECCWSSRWSMNEDSNRSSRRRATSQPWRGVVNQWRRARSDVERQEDSESNDLVTKGRSVREVCQEVGYCSIL